MVIHYDLAIVGGGFSGTLVAAHLAERAPAGYRLALFEPGEPGRGAAYGTPHGQMLLNTRAAAVSAFPGQPDHFVRWLGDRASGADFVSRRLYGDYLAEIGRNALRRPQFEHRRARVIAIRRPGHRFVVRDDAGHEIESAQVVLATGNPPPNAEVLPAGVRSHPGYVGDPWRFDYARVDGEVLLIGTGLTALDALVALDAAGFAGPIVAVSRRGRFPEVHAPVAAFPAAPALDASSAGALLRSLRDQLEEAAIAGYDWRAVVDAIRPESEVLWRRLPEAERRRFEAHLRTHWERLRHRAPPAVDVVRAALVESGRLEVLAGRLAGGEGGQVEIALRDGTRRSLRPRWIVNCSGLARDRRGAADPLLAALVAGGLAAREQLGLGIRVDERLRVIDAQGAATDGLWALGPPVRGARFEATAVPELRVMAAAIAAEAMKRGTLSAGASWAGKL
jgi:uncharacterized NAD(P)/FAD-binding protein YdhS